MPELPCPFMECPEAPKLHVHLKAHLKKRHGLKDKDAKKLYKKHAENAN
jgi:hypothetical protein